MFAKIKTPVFIDALTLELVDAIQSTLCAILRDDKGLECSRMETSVTQGNNTLTWKGLNELPYGVYTLELSQGQDESTHKIVKRI
jgi:hypothetical protein